AEAAKLLFINMGLGGVIYLLGEMKLFLSSNAFLVSIGQLGRSTLRLGGPVPAPTPVGAMTQFSAPAISPAYIGVGYIIGPRLAVGMKRAVADLRKVAGTTAAVNRTEIDLNAKVVFGGLGVVLLCMVVLYLHFTGTLPGAITAAIVMMILGFFFAAVSGNL